MAQSGSRNPMRRLLIGILCTIGMAAGLSACSTPASASGTVVTRVSSPDGTIDAVLTESNPGATSSYSYFILVVPHDEAVSDNNWAVKLYGATRSEIAYGVTLAWSDAHTILATYLDAKSVTQNSETVTVADQRITIELDDGVMNSEAPAGGMAHAAS